jgi:hypothetical protein
VSRIMRTHDRADARLPRVLVMPLPSMTTITASLKMHEAVGGRRINGVRGFVPLVTCLDQRFVEVTLKSRVFSPPVAHTDAGRIWLIGDVYRAV